ncbi:MAG: cytochrome c3 family protein [Planctomycetota bacterium]
MCHSKIEGVTEKEDKCSICHLPPENPIVKEGLTINHKSFLAKGIDCTNCHIEMTMGESTVSKDKCFHCHNELEKIEKFDDKDLIHINHVTIRKVECVRCHEPIKHFFNTRIIHNQNKNCNVCHSKEFHTIQQNFYMGQGAKKVMGKPDPMFQVGIGCNACHIVPASRAGFNIKNNKTFIANNYSCYPCHNKKYKTFVSDFNKNIGYYIQRLENFLQSVSPLNKEELNISFNLTFLKTVKPIHNPFYSIDILHQSFKDMEHILKFNGEDKKKEEFKKEKIDFENNVCNICHKSIPIKEEIILEENKKFPHKMHIEEIDLKCTDCHNIKSDTPLSFQHPLKVSDKQICSGCHN